MTVSAAAAAGLAAAIFGCASVGGDSMVWKRPCATDAHRQADRQACMGESAGLSDPSSGRGAEYATDLFRECMEGRGWQRVPASTTLACQ